MAGGIEQGKAGAFRVRSDGEPSPRKPPPPKYDRALAMAIWVMTGLFAGLALGIFTGHGWLCLAIGLVLGLVLAVWRTRPNLEIDQD